MTTAVDGTKEGTPPPSPLRGGEERKKETCPKTAVTEDGKTAKVVKVVKVGAEADGTDDESLIPLPVLHPRCRTWHVGFPSFIPVFQVPLLERLSPASPSSVFQKWRLTSPKNWRTFLRTFPFSRDLGTTTSSTRGTSPFSFPPSRKAVLYHELLTPHFLLWNRTQESLDSFLFLNPNGPWPELQGIEIDFLANRLLSYFSRRQGFESIEKFPVTEGDWETGQEWNSLHDPQGLSAVLVFESQEYCTASSQIFESGGTTTSSSAAADDNVQEGGSNPSPFLWFDPLEWETVFGSGHRFLVRPMFLVP